MTAPTTPTTPAAPAGPWLVLIGPAGAGKSTLGMALAELAGREFVDIDEAGVPFYEEMGWPVARIFSDSARLGWIPTERAWEVARAHAVEQVVARSAGAVLALGAGHTNYTNPELFSRVKAALAQAEHVLWIEPHAEPQESLRLLRARNLAERERDYIQDGHDILGEWLTDAQARSLATARHYNHGKDVAVSAAEVIAVITGAAT